MNLMYHFLGTAVMWSPWVLVAATAQVQADEAASPPSTSTVFLGTYTNGESHGIYSCRLDLASGKLEGLRLAAETANPSFLAVHPNGNCLYAVGRGTRGKSGEQGRIAAFEIDRSTGSLLEINEMPTKGAGPCHVCVDPSGRFALAANYSSGSVEAFRIGDDGQIAKPASFVQHVGSSIHPERQSRPHAHSVNFGPAGRFAFVADLGLDQVLVYRLDATTGLLTPAEPPHAGVTPGSGPRHFAFHPGGEFAYVLNELASSVTAFEYDGQGRLRELQTISALPADYQGNHSAAEVQVHPSGRFLYSSNRGHDSIAAFSIDEDTGHLQLIEIESTRGQWPRNFGIDPAGRYLLAANQNSDNVVIMRIDAVTGELEPTGHELAVPSPVCVRFLRGSAE